MAKRPTKVALIYDFDETLSTGYMQDFSLIPALGMKPDRFWKMANQWSADQEADQVTGSMYYFMKTAKEKKTPPDPTVSEKMRTKHRIFPGSAGMV